MTGLEVSSVRKFAIRTAAAVTAADLRLTDQAAQPSIELYKYYAILCIRATVVPSTHSRALSLLLSNPLFTAADWIGVGKKYPTHPPQHLLNAVHAVLYIPLPAASIIPGPSVSVMQLLELQLPTADRVRHFSIPIFMALDTDCTVADIIQIPILTLSVINDLQNLVGQAWLDGKTSVIVPQVSTPLAAVDHQLVD